MRSPKFYLFIYTQLSQDEQTSNDRRSPGGADVDEDEDGASRSASKTPPPPPKEGGVRVSVTSPPGLLSSPAVGSVISPFGSPSTWISEDHGATADKSNVRINGDHVTQVRVDALVLESHHPVAAVAAAAVPAEEDRDQSELVVNPRSKDHVTAVQVEHTTSISQPP